MWRFDYPCATRRCWRSWRDTWINHDKSRWRFGGDSVSWNGTGCAGLRTLLAGFCWVGRGVVALLSSGGSFPGISGGTPVSILMFVVVSGLYFYTGRWWRRHRVWRLTFWLSCANVVNCTGWYIWLLIVNFVCFSWFYVKNKTIFLGFSKDFSQEKCCWFFFPCVHRSGAKWRQIKFQDHDLSAWCPDFILVLVL